MAHLQAGVIPAFGEMGRCNRFHHPYDVCQRCRHFKKRSIAAVKKTFRYSNGFFYNRLYRNPLFRHFIMESGANYDMGPPGFEPGTDRL